MARLFTGDYSNGKLSQWGSMLTAQFNTDAINHPATGSYPAQIISLGDCGYSARYELRPGDTVLGSGLTSERCEAVCEATAGSPAFAAVGTTRWYAFSLKFDESWPEQTEIGWMNLVQWRDASVGGSPVLSFGWDVPEAPGFNVGYWPLRWNPQSSPGVGGLTLTGYAAPIAQMPLDLGRWHDIKMRVVWSTDDAVGSVQLWHNGIRQTFTSEYGGSTIDGGSTFLGRTATPQTTPSPGAAPHQGIYREPSAETNILYHAGFRMADNESSL